MRTYRLFFVSNTEDILWRRYDTDEHNKAKERLEAMNEVRRQWLKKIDEEGTGETVKTSA